MGALAKRGDVESNSGMEDGLKTGKWLVFHPGEMLTLLSLEHLPVLSSRCGDRFGGQLVCPLKT